jgi:hypothetical protein
MKRYDIVHLFYLPPPSGKYCKYQIDCFMHLTARGCLATKPVDVYHFMHYITRMVS